MTTHYHFDSYLHANAILEENFPIWVWDVQDGDWSGISCSTGIFLWGLKAMIYLIE
jgi:hypothetical protein